MQCVLIGLANVYQKLPEAGERERMGKKRGVGRMINKRERQVKENGWERRKI